jgi:hypothetical protein
MTKPDDGDRFVSCGCYVEFEVFDNDIIELFKELEFFECVFFDCKFHGTGAKFRNCRFQMTDGKPHIVQTSGAYINCLFWMPPAT